MSTAVFVHAHPDDEAIATAGAMMQGVELGHRVVVVCATDGAVGEANESKIPDGLTLGDVRTAEMHAAAEIMGLDRVVFLGYRDSGMNGEPTNDDPECFWQADVEEAAKRLAAILREESAGLLTIYDEIGGYHHPDHIQVHRVGLRAAELAGTRIVFESTMNREQMQSFADDPAFGDLDMSEEEREAARDEFRDQELGTPAAKISHAVDATPWISRKRAAMAAHHSQIDEDTFFLMLPDEAFATAFGTEWFVRRGATRTGEPYETDIYADL